VTVRVDDQSWMRHALELARRAAAEGLSGDDIKRAVRSWRADTHRV